MTYCWVITHKASDEDLIEQTGKLDELKEHEMKYGGSFINLDTPKAKFAAMQEARRHGLRFRLLDADSLVYYMGCIAGACGFEPLDEFGAGSGCTSIEYLDDKGEWIEL